MCDEVSEAWVVDAVAEVAAQYDEPHRAYHTRRHVAEVLAALRAQFGTHPLQPALILAAWFHDVVYDPRGGPGSNEHASGDRVREVLTRFRADDDLIEEVFGHVIDTSTHTISEDLAPAVYQRRTSFLDADLWILSAPQPRYEEYCQQIRQEYAHVTDDVFLLGRTGLVQSFLARDHVYLTDHPRQQWEPRARANLTRELHNLRLGQWPAAADAQP